MSRYISLLGFFLVFAGFSWPAFAAPAKQDVVLVVDNSKSMTLLRLSIGVDNFFRDLAYRVLDWRVSLYTHGETKRHAAAQSGKATGLQAEAVFSSVLKTLDQRGPAREAPFQTVLDLVEAQYANNDESFVRGGTDLHLVFFTDAAEQSGISYEELLTALKTKTKARRITVHGLFAAETPCEITDKENGLLEPRWAYAGSPFAELIAATNGFKGELCIGNYQPARSIRLLSQTITK